MKETKNKTNKHTKYLTIHGHFYQPPRENPWIEEIELQESAQPQHDWNDRICWQCYEPNSVSRIVDNQNRILNIVNNYELMSFNKVTFADIKITIKSVVSKYFTRKTQRNPMVIPVIINKNA